MLHLHFSNRHERLQGVLLGHLAAGGADPFASEQVIVPSAAHRRALALAITDREGVCANVAFPFLARWLWQQVGRVVQVQAESPLDVDALTWRVGEALRDGAFVQRHPRLQAWLAAAGADELMRHELASRVAVLLDQYVTYRPEWLQRWRDAQGGEADPDEAWQADLWRRIARELQVAVDHPLEVLVQRLSAAGRTLAQSSGLPARVHVFGLSAVPPLYLATLQQLSRWIDVHLYVLNPCRDYWHDLVGPRELSRKEAQGQLGFEIGHPLLASWGRQTQAHLALLLEQAEGMGAQTHEHFQAAAGPSLLAALQDSLLDLRELAPGSVDPPAGDRSLEVHVCHSMTRELEVLHDYLLALFAANPGLRPADVLVVTPDLASAAPLIEGVFGSVPAARRIPFEITGLGRAPGHRPTTAFLQLLALVSSRVAATGLHGLLQQDAIARRFGLDEAGLQQVHDWLLAAGVHWGLDEEQLAQEQLPPSGHTVATGLERVLLAYALPDTVDDPVAGLLPAGQAEGLAALPLGAFHAFVRELRSLRRSWSTPRLPDAWRSFLHDTADRFLAVADDELEALAELHAGIDALADAMERGGVRQPVAAAVVRQALEDALEDPARGGVPTGRVTFTGMSTLRGLPFQVVCVLGLNDTQYPRPERPAEFDLMARRPRLGDRQRGADQRNVFLDLVLAARSHLYLSYAGRSVFDNAALPPSVLVAELLDAVLPALAQAPRDKPALERARRRIVVEHPLQPFSLQAFSQDADPRVRSFDEALAQALRESLERAPALEQVADAAPMEDDDEDEVAEPALPFFTGALAAPGPEWRDLRVEQLVEFYRDPSRYLLRRRMGVDLPWEEAGLEDDEPFLSSVPARSALADRLLPRLLAGATAADALALARAGTEFPPGALGDAELQAEVAALGAFAQAVRSHLAATLPQPHESVAAVPLEGEAWTVRGAFADLGPQGRLRWRYDDERANDVLRAWIEHVLLCAAPPAGVEPVTRCLARDGLRRFEPLDPATARDHLRRLVQDYRQGLREPLRFFPRTAWKLVTAGPAQARTTWSGGREVPGEKDRSGHRLVLRGEADVLDGRFEALARAMFEPALAASRREGATMQEPA